MIKIQVNGKEQDLRQKAKELASMDIAELEKQLGIENNDKRKRVSFFRNTR